MAPVKDATVLSPGSRYPDDAGIVDVKLLYGAKGDGVTDDTRAIQQALTDHPNRKVIIYLPRGTYLISDRLDWPFGKGTGDEYKQTILEGESREATILKLRDACPGYRNPRLPKAMIWTGPHPAQRFGNSIRSMTIDTGTGNAGAIGAQFHANNQGVIYDVTFRSGDGAGVAGIDMNFTNEIGPLYIHDTAVLGFDVGILTGKPINGQVLENVQLKGQRKFGILDSGQALTIRKLRSENEVPAIESKGGFIALLDSELIATGTTMKTEPAIRIDGDILVRDLRTTGYARALETTKGAAPAGVAIQSFVSLPPKRLFEGGKAAFPLPIEETPDVPWDPPEEWANVRDYGALAGDDEPDDEGIQRAIDSGKTTVYLSNAPTPEGKRGAYNLQGTVYLRGNVRRLIGTEASLWGGEDHNGTLKVVDGTSDTVVIERIGTSFPGARIEVETSRTVVIKQAQIAAYSGVGGKVFFEDVSGGPWDVWRMKNQTVFARQFNPEFWPDTAKAKGSLLINDGGSLWILGFKTEQPANTNVVETVNGGRTEILGGHLYTYIDSKGGSRAMFITKDSALSAFVREAQISRESYGTYVEAWRGKDVKRVTREELPGGAFGGRAISYIGGLPE